MDNLNVRIHASHIRAKLSKGWPAEAKKPGKFLYILNLLPDECLIQMDATHARESAEHQALLRDYKARQANEAKSDDSRLAKLYDAAQAQG